MSCIQEDVARLDAPIVSLTLIGLAGGILTAVSGNPFAPRRKLDD